MDGTGQHDADSDVDVKGDHYTLSGSTLTHPVLDAIQVPGSAGAWRLCLGHMRPRQRAVPRRPAPRAAE